MSGQRADAARGTGYSILLHAVLIGLLLFGMRSVSQRGGDAGGDGALQADVASINDLSAKTRRALLGEPKEAAQPLPQPVEVPQELPKPVEAPVEPTPQPVVKETPPAKPVPERPQPPVKTPPPKPEPTPVDASKKVPTPEPVKKTVESDIAARAAAEAARLAKATNLAKQRAEQVADARLRNPAEASAQVDATMSGGKSGGKTNRGSGCSGGQQKWLNAVARAIAEKWVRPDGVPVGKICPIHIRIIPGGEVIEATVQPDCPYSAEAKRSVEKAVHDASPLPFQGYDKDWFRDFVANFSPDGTGAASSSGRPSARCAP